MSETNCILAIINGERDDPKARIIKAGVEEFAMQSVEGARTREIARAAGVNLAAINYYFGSKEGLYLEIVREIAEAMHRHKKPYFDRAKELFDKPDPAKARELLMDFLFSHVSEACENRFYLSISLIIVKEEIYPAQGFDIFYQRVFKSTNEMAVRLIEVATQGRVTGERATLLSVMLFGQVRAFWCCRQGVMRANKWKQIGQREIDKVRALLTSNLDRILQK